MILIRGWILLENEENCDYKLFSSFCDRVKHDLELIARTVNMEAHNGVVALTFLDFSNHAGEALSQLKKIESELPTSKFVIEAVMRLTDDEHENYYNFEYADL